MSTKVVSETAVGERMMPHATILNLYCHLIDAIAIANRKLRDGEITPYGYEAILGSIKPLLVYGLLNDSDVVGFDDYIADPAPLQRKGRKKRTA